jgi:hypothetical protein
MKEVEEKPNIIPQTCIFKEMSELTLETVLGAFGRP